MPTKLMDGDGWITDRCEEIAFDRWGRDYDKLSGQSRMEVMEQATLDYHDAWSMNE